MRGVNTADVVAGRFEFGSPTDNTIDAVIFCGGCFDMMVDVID